MKLINRVIHVCIVNENIQEYNALFESIYDAELKVFLTTGKEREDANVEKIEGIQKLIENKPGVSFCVVLWVTNNLAGNEIPLFTNQVVNNAEE